MKTIRKIRISGAVKNLSGLADPVSRFVGPSFIPFHVETAENAKYGDLGYSALVRLMKPPRKFSAFSAAPA
jgi:hypothetical protein